MKMAWLVSAAPLRASLPTPTLTKEGVHDLDSALPPLSLTTAQKVLGSCSSNKQILSTKGSCHNCLMSGARSLNETFSYNLDVDYCSEIVISGYWVGPDVDDGWGFVEALIINQMT
ncbi:hypothetical protein RIF29_22065 [Crotalaria pallida]|uniref:Uncharacterized protein n=1 Tax=Crotalaria pallida TaxID=3830 RepID=A0AAN9F8M4_CROPI